MRKILLIAGFFIALNASAQITYPTEVEWQFINAATGTDSAYFSSNFAGLGFGLTQRNATADPNSFLSTYLISENGSVYSHLNSDETSYLRWQDAAGNSTKWYMGRDATGVGHERFNLINNTSDEDLHISAYLLHLTEDGGGQSIQFDSTGFNISANATATNLGLNGTITEYNNATPTDGQLLIGSTADGNFKIGTLSANGGVTITNEDGDIQIGTSLTLDAGTYTPTITAVSNLDATTTAQCQYMRVGNVVTVSGVIEIDPTASALTEFRISLPIASDITAVTNLAGTSIVTAATTRYTMQIQGDVANDAAFVSAYTTFNANNATSFSFTYLIQ